VDNCAIHRQYSPIKNPSAGKRNLMNSCARLSALALGAGLFLGGSLEAQSQTPSTQQQGFTFALIGDLGYFPREEPWLENVLADINGNSSLAFVVYVGDLSSPRYGCTDELVSRRLAKFRASAHPFIYTPGDNEWTDCHEGQGVKGGDPLERLITLRKVFFQGEPSLGQRTLALTHQSADPDFAKYRENVRWDFGDVTFVTVNVPGSNNGLGRSFDGDAEYAERNKADLAWIHQGFEHAKVNNTRAIMIMQQANIFPDFPPFPGDPKKAEGYTDIRALLEREATAFGKPVVLVHGDSHYFRIDNPFRQKREPGKPVEPSLENFLRL
jgi:hypothetical protein